MDKILSPKFVLVLFSITACAGFILGKLAPELFANALLVVLAYYYGSKNGEKAAKAEAAGLNTTE